VTSFSSDCPCTVHQPIQHAPARVESGAARCNAAGKPLMQPCAALCGAVLQAKAAAEARQLAPTPRQAQTAAVKALAAQQRPTVITRLPEQFNRQVSAETHGRCRESGGEAEGTSTCGCRYDSMITVQQVYKAATLCAC
jgi:hypothetical protein